MFKLKSKTKEPENAAKAYEYAVFLLSLKLRTVGEVLLKMQGRGYGENVIAEVLEKLKDQRYLDDQRYAEIFLENLKAYKNLGYYGIKKKFMEKKISTPLIESVLAQGLSLEDELKIMKRLLKKEGFEAKSKVDDGESTYQTFDEDSSKQKQKIMNRLKSRGFRGEVIARLVF
jgi:regulatory protein